VVRSPYPFGHSALRLFKMFSAKVFVSLLAISASAFAAPSLSLKVSGADVAEGVENLKVTATLTNTGDSTLKLLNDPRTVRLLL